MKYIRRSDHVEKAAAHLIATRHGTPRWVYAINDRIASETSWEYAQRKEIIETYVKEYEGCFWTEYAHDWLPVIMVHGDMDFARQLLHSGCPAESYLQYENGRTIHYNSYSGTNLGVIVNPREDVKRFETACEILRSEAEAIHMTLLSFIFNH